MKTNQIFIVLEKKLKCNELVIMRPTKKHYSHKKRNLLSKREGLRRGGRHLILALHQVEDTKMIESSTGT